MWSHRKQGPPRGIRPSLMRPSRAFVPPGAVELSRRHPVASWLCAMLHCFGSYILADLLLGEPLIDYFSNNSSILLASAVWYLIFFCPLDLFYKCVCFLPVKLIFVAMKEVVRVRKIAVGIHHAHHHYHHGWFIMIATGWVKGSGVALLSNVEQLLRGVWKPETNEILHMSFPTKASLYGAILFTLQQTRWLPVSKASLIFIFTMFMVSCKVSLSLSSPGAAPHLRGWEPATWMLSVYGGSLPGGSLEDSLYFIFLRFFFLLYIFENRVAERGRKRQRQREREREIFHLLVLSLNGWAKSKPGACGSIRVSHAGAGAQALVPSLLLSMAH
uniref:Trimeric intracellular cation channel type A n=1 Tax=Oryctolagus cuniculus TaxID=9986 RepID=A0A5F9DHC3_RABIT